MNVELPLDTAYGHATVVSQVEENFLDRSKTRLLLSDERHRLWKDKYPPPPFRPIEPRSFGEDEVGRLRRRPAPCHERRMTSPFTENQVHAHILATGLSALIENLEPPPEQPLAKSSLDDEGIPFDLWRIIRGRAVKRIERLHHLVRDGEIIGSKLKLKVDATQPMELDFLGSHEEGLFVLELKVDRAAERNAFSELFGYSNYIAGMFSLSGRKDVSNVLIAPMVNKITSQAYLYDLLIADRDIIVYQPVFTNGDLSSLRLRPFVPADDVFRSFVNHLLSHEAMSCVVLSFENVPSWIDSASEPHGTPPAFTLETLADVSGHAAQLMEAEGLHGFCFVRKWWKEVEPAFENALILVALNPFEFVQRERLDAILAQLAPEHHCLVTEFAGTGFKGRLFNAARRAFTETVGAIVPTEAETPLWYGLVTSPTELVQNDKVGFRPTGIFREAYASYMESTYLRNDEVAARAAAGRERDNDYEIDVPTLRLNFLHAWLRAWTFMESWSPYRRDEGDVPDENLQNAMWDTEDRPSFRGRKPTFG